MTAWYNADLAYIHDVGFRDYALKSAPGVLEILTARQIPTGLIVDLGCGSGLLTELLERDGYRVLGIDISPAMISIAQERVPTAEFRIESLFTAEIPACAAVVSIGECLNYVFDDNCDLVLNDLFQRIYRALIPGGIFIFDIVTPGQVPAGEVVKNFTEGQDWIVLVEKQEDLTRQILTRRIITFRQIGELYRRSEEVHLQRLFDVESIAKKLEQIGFRVEILDRYGQFRLPPARVAFIVQKPYAKI
ncbi:class I SAM-dependent methyltransferase [Chamaesiphon polymorphus]|uniref:Class I SAM-dependent methyltransferase n=1 Tax=Chamaesiphon polymorphus CCALA 037 TaxID=2107692 RepID=A0A2T1GAD2_9CYAN|nr:class I SAM-dependent methyltransferase [Chamaesiphon polymorphus]PSB54195.1 class I SAM-dependent methyltransferase [Chamaesiphon polymorphus CCALA 037]